MADYATLLRDHVAPTVRSMDRISLQAYVPKLPSVGQVYTLLRWERGYAFFRRRRSGRSDSGTQDIERFAAESDIVNIRLEKGESNVAGVTSAARWQRQARAIPVLPESRAVRQ